MDYAIDSRSGQRVRACDPKTVKSSYYVCPNCSTPVIFRRGGERVVAHFAHKSNQAKVSCELYMSSDSEWSTDRYLTEREAPYRTLGLYVRLIDEQATQVNWTLEIGIPEPDVDTGSIRMPLAWGGQRVIPVSAIKSGGQRVRVLPGTGPFTILHDNVPEGRWKNRIANPVMGLSATSINVFRYSPFGGRQLSKERSLYWGRSYVLLWAASCSPSWWPSEDYMQTTPLKGYGVWTGKYIQLPVSRNEQVEKWVKEHIGSLVLHPLAEIELIAPLPEYRLPDGSYIIQNGNKATLGIIGEPGVRKWNKILCHSLKTGVTQKIPGKGLVPSVVQIQLENGRNSIWLDDDLEESLQIIVDSRESYSCNFPEIRILARDNANLEEQELSLHIEKAEFFLKRAYEGTVTFTGIDIPVRVNVDVKWKEAGKGEQLLCRISKENPEGIADFEEKVLELLNRLNKRDMGYLCIDAGGFGHVRIEAPLNQTAKASVQFLDMGEVWRRKALYILSSAKSTAQGRLTNIYRRIDTSKFCAKDQAILHRIASQGKWPVTLAPYCWALLNECEKAQNLYYLKHGRE